MSRINVADDTGVRVMVERCATCIFRPGNLMQLQSGRVKSMLAEVKANEGCIPCHQTLDDEVQAVCRGQFDVLKTQPLQIAERLGYIQWYNREANREATLGSGPNTPETPDS